MKELIIRDDIDEYLSVSKYINWNNDSIISKADEFKLKFTDEISLVKSVYEFVRDEIMHSWDAQDKRVTKSATECWNRALAYAGQKQIFLLLCSVHVEYLQAFVTSVLHWEMCRKLDFVFML